MDDSIEGNMDCLRGGENDEGRGEREGEREREVFVRSSLQCCLILDTSTPDAWCNLIVPKLGSGHGVCLQYYVGSVPHSEPRRISVDAVSIIGWMV